MNASTAAPAPTHASIWHTMWLTLVSIFTSPAVQTVAEVGIDAGLAATGSGAIVPLVNEALPAAASAITGMGELLAAAHTAQASGQPITNQTVAANLNLTQATLDSLIKVVGIAAPKVADQMAKAGVVIGAVAAAASPAPAS